MTLCIHVNSLILKKRDTYLLTYLLTLIERNQLTFLHHIVHLEEDDPVKRMWESQRLMSGERNWWYTVSRSMDKYNITLEDVVSKSKESFKAFTKKKIKEVALVNLQEDCKGKKKTKNLVYDSLKPQEYFSKLYPTQAKAVFLARCQSLDIKEHRRYKYKDMVCRLCKTEEETLSHIVNCGSEKELNTDILFHNFGEDALENQVLLLIAVSTRIVNFLEYVK